MHGALIDWDGPTPEPGWQEALDRIAPRTPYGHDWLLLRWEPGDPWAPVERWVIWQMTPFWRVPAGFGILEALRGPNPRTFNYYDEAKGEFVRTRYSPISRQQWELYQETECWAQPLWIVQGRNGGHMKEWTDVQSTISQMHGGPPAPPRARSLPYAPFDARVAHRLKAMDLVDKYGDTLERLTTNPSAVDWLDQRERAQVVEMAEQLWSWLSLQVEESLNPGGPGEEGLTRAHIDAIRDHADPNAEEPDYEAIEEGFIEQVAHNYGEV